MTAVQSTAEWIGSVIKQNEIDKYLVNGQDFIDDRRIEEQLKQARPDPARIKDIIAKALDLQRLDPEETAALIALSPREKDLWQQIYAAAGTIKNKVYGSRIVTFAPLYVSNLCVNDCLYCGYRSSNTKIRRKRLSDNELRAEIQALVSAGHKRLIMVYGEHPLSDVDYIAHTIQLAYETKVGNGEIRRANINAAPLSIDQLRLLKDIGIGTYQVFQETCHHATYRKLHPRGIKADYRWRLYALHRSLEAGADDVAIGALFGLHDWRFEIMGLLYHAMDLEHHFGGVGPHTISFPRLVPAVGTPFCTHSQHLVDDDTMERVIAILRLSVPYTGMILTCRESAAVRDRFLELGVTQLDFGSNIGVGDYSTHDTELDKQQFILQDTRSLDEGIRWLAQRGHLTSFCTAGYRCGRTGHYFMDIAKQGKVHTMCMPNAILTFQEYLLDYASPATRQAGEALIADTLAGMPATPLKDRLQQYVKRLRHGERDLYV